MVEELWPEVEYVSKRGEYGDLTFFEFVTAMAFLHFSKIEADFQVIEVGLGGRLDATNVVSPEVCVITPIMLDHVAVLGDTIELIAGEKAGIIKPGVPSRRFSAVRRCHRRIRQGRVRAGCEAD